MKKILLIGSNGMLGSALHHVLRQQHNISLLDRSQFDIANASWDRLSVKGFDYVINAAGLIKRRPENDENFYKVNSIFPHVLSTLCERHGARLIHFSTDCVFDGIQAPFYENSSRSAIDTYGSSKALGEPSMGLVIRTSIIGPEANNFYNLLCWTLAQSRIDGFTNHLWNGVTTLELARLVDRIISKSLYTDGVRHIFSDDHSKYDLIKLICQIFSHPAKLSPVEASPSRDMRLRTNYPEFLRDLGVRQIVHQLEELLLITQADGRWMQRKTESMLA